MPLLLGQKNISVGKILFPEGLKVFLAPSPIIPPGFIESLKGFPFQEGTILKIGSFMPGNRIFEKFFDHEHIRTDF
jgi:hypothetical protein